MWYGDNTNHRDRRQNLHAKTVHLIILKQTMDPIDDINNYKWGIFYYNPSDPRTLVPKRVRMMGWQLNFARGSQLILPIIIVIVLITIISKLFP